MEWTWDQVDITFDQECWTFDGDNSCTPDQTEYEKHPIDDWVYYAQSDREVEW